MRVDCYQRLIEGMEGKKRREEWNLAKEIFPLFEQK